MRTAGAPTGAPTGAPALAVLLDLDGTLVDTVALWNSAYLRLADELGVDAPADLWERVVGRSMRASLAVFGEVAAREDPDRLVARLVSMAAEGLSAVGAAGDAEPGGWSWLPGARELLATLREAGPTRPRVALVTSAWRAFTLPLLEEGLGGPETVAATFDALVCGDDVLDGKPAPEGHLRAAELVGATPDECLVIEDSPTGVAAAEAAGMVTLVVPRAATIAAAPGRALRTDLVGLSIEALTAMHARLRSDVAG